MHPSFTLHPANAAAVAAICVRLDGLPLAIELAAARAGVLSPQALLPRLTHCLDLLTGGARDQPERHQTLRATISWSYGLLDTTEQRLFRLLGVFASGCPLDAAEAVSRGVEQSRSREGDPLLDCSTPRLLDSSRLDSVASLVDKSLLGWGEQPDGEPRFAMLETIREFALERLAEGGEADAARRAHAGYYLALAEAMEAAVTGPRQRAALDRLDTEHGNLRGALAWALDAGEHETAQRLAWALCRFWEMRGHLSEGRRWLTTATAQGGHGSSPARARALTGLAFVAMHQVDLPAAVAAVEEGLALWRAVGDLPGRSLGLNVLGDIRLRQGDTAAAYAAFAESLACSRAAHHRRGIARALNNLAEATQDRDPAEAATLFAESLALFRELDDLPGIAYTLGNLGVLARRQGNLAVARDHHTEQLRIARATVNKPHIATALHYLGAVAILAGDLGQAGSCYAESLAMWRAIGDLDGVAGCLEGIGAVAAARGDPARVARFWGAAHALRAANNTLLSPPDRARHDQDLAAARRTCDETAWAEAWAAGGSLSLEQVAVEVATDTQGAGAREDRGQSTR